MSEKTYTMSAESYDKWQELLTELRNNLWDGTATCYQYGEKHNLLTAIDQGIIENDRG